MWMRLQSCPTPTRTPYVSLASPAPAHLFGIKGRPNLVRHPHPRQITYTKPWSRAGPYLVGYGTCMLYRQLVTAKGRFTTLGRRFFRLPTAVTWTATAAALLLGFVVLYGVSGSYGAPGFPALTDAGNVM